jgi:serine/threonine protein kinase
MRMLQEHPNVVRLVEVFEDHLHFMLVLEHCSGGELFDQIIDKASGVWRSCPGPAACSPWPMGAQPGSRRMPAAGRWPRL